MNQQPFWTLLPHINNRTAWKPISFPAILIIPFGSDSSGNPLSQSAPKDITISILDVVRRNKVSGHQNQDVFFPDRELYTITISGLELNKRLLDINDFENDGTHLKIINRRGVSGDVPYDPNSLYYDFSDVEISVENLKHGRYQLSYQARLNKRVYDSLGGLVCIDDTQDDLIIFNNDINHPGEIIDEMVKTTPSIWFNNQDLGKDPIITLYKPLTDCLQNVFDEQILLSRINFISKAYPETIQLLGQTIGWEIPYFPKSLDPLRRSVLRTSTFFQKNRSGFNNIHQLFDLFGYNILLRNLWYSPDNSRLEEPSYEPYTPVQIQDKYVLDIAVGNLIAPGFYTTDVQLICKPGEKTKYDNFSDIGSDIYVESYVVKIGSAAQNAINGFIANGNYDDISEISSGVINNDLNSRLVGLDVYASHQLKISKSGVHTEIYKTGPRDILFSPNISLDKYKPSVKISLDGHWNDKDLAIYVFVIYKTQKIIIADPNYEEKRSNFFDIRVNSRNDTLSPTSLVLDYALEFLYRVKALHSLLRHIFIESNSCEVYLVTDYCYGPGLSVSSDSDIGQQQVPPAITPIDNDSKCDEQDARLLGYKESDISYRTKITAGLIEEWNSYLSYDNRLKEGGILNMLPQIPELARIVGTYNGYGQDTFINTFEQYSAFGIIEPFHLANQHIYTSTSEIYDYNTNLIGIENRCTELRQTGELLYDGPYQPVNNLSVREPICFKGRVSGDLYINQSIVSEEQVLLSDCVNHMGHGANFTTPKRSIIVRAGSENRLLGSQSPKPIISTNLPESGIDFEDFLMNDYDLVGYDPIRLSGDSDEVLHYWDRQEHVDSTWHSAANNVPNYGIQRTNMHFPGTRFISMAKFQGTFVDPVYTKRPWDLDVCDNVLNARLVKGVDNNEYLVFDQTPYTFTSTTGTPDIPAMGSPISSSIAPTDVVHAIYSQYADGLTPGLCPYDTTIDSDGIKNVNVALFKSASLCGTGDLRDYADGYPCVTGILTFTIDFDSDYDFFTGATSGITSQFLFLLMSGIVDGSFGIRLDCDCTITPCDVTAPINTCAVKETDVIDVSSYLVLPESAGVCSFVLDGEISTMFELQD